MFRIVFGPAALDEMKTLRAFDRRRVADEIQMQLAHEPLVETRNRKPLRRTADSPPNRPTWELRVGDVRVFYDPDRKSRTVVVRAVRLKTQGRTTEDIL